MNTYTREAFVKILIVLAGFIGLLKSSEVNAQNTLVMSSFLNGTPPCGDAPDSVCCNTIQVTINRSGTRWFRLELEYGDTNWLNIWCIQHTWTVNGSPPAAGNTMHINFSGTTMQIDIDTLASGWTAGTTIELQICHRPYSQLPGYLYSYKGWRLQDFWTYDDAYPDDSNPQDHNNWNLYSEWCHQAVCTEQCDSIEYSEDTTGVDSVQFCVHRQGGLFEGTKIKLTIKPPLKSCNGGMDWSGKCFRIISQGDTIARRSPSGGVELYVYNGIADSCINRYEDTTVINNADSTVMTFTPRSTSYNLGECGLFCIKIKRCPPGQDVNHTIKLETLPNNSDPSCDQDTNIVFKTGSPGNMIQVNTSSPWNYPNPFGSANGFKTTIPFNIPEGGTVIIKISDESGRFVLSDEQVFDGEGRHFFYFTGDQLPAGTYFYRIESPKGNILVQKQMVLIK